MLVNRLLFLRRLLELLGGNYFGGYVAGRQEQPATFRITQNEVLAGGDLSISGEFHHDRHLFPRKQFLEPNKVRLRKRSSLIV
jgi:hypothetical protein